MKPIVFTLLLFFASTAMAYKCPTCVMKGLKSTVSIGYGETTAIAAFPFYDEDGRRHYHDPNVTTTNFSCSNGHEWTTQVLNSFCLSCEAEKRGIK